MQYTSYEINAINKFPDLPPNEAIAEYKKLSAKGGAKTRGMKKPWVSFATNKELARQAGIKGAKAKWAKVNETND